MKIDLKEIFQLQIELDRHIHQEHNVNYTIIQPELKLALFTELAECANEIRSFKFWSFKKPSDRNVILEEYVDGIHFITALGLSHNASTIYEVKPQVKFEAKRDITNGFNQLFATVESIHDAKSVQDWYTNYLEFGLKLGFTLDEIVDAYKAKCKINHQRQENKY